MSEIRLVIAIPTAGMVRMDFAYSLAGLVSYLAANCIPSRQECSLTVAIDVAASSVIHGNRESLVMRAIAADRTHILFLDDDMCFDPSVANILFSRRQPVVATNYMIKDEKRDKFVAIALEGNKRIATRASSTGLVPICYSGFGVSLFEVEVFKKTPQPWFHPLWIEANKGYTTEDNPCYERIRNAGFPCYVDQDASKLVRHLGFSSWDWTEFKENGNG